MGRGVALATATIVVSGVAGVDLAAVVHDAVKRQAVAAVKRPDKETNKSRLVWCKRSMYRN
jgi:hypothetical protein